MPSSVFKGSSCSLVAIRSVATLGTLLRSLPAGSSIPQLGGEMPWEEITEAMDRLRNRDVAGKIALYAWRLCVCEPPVRCADDIPAARPRRTAHQGQALGRLAADWPGLERGAKTEDEGREARRYRPDTYVAKRARLGAELASQTASNRRPVPGNRLDRLLGDLVRAVAARPRAIRRAAVRSPGAGCSARHRPSSTAEHPEER